MKTKLTLIVILTLSIFVGHAQQAVPNGGLEIWTASPYSPDGWTSYEDIIPPLAGTGLSMKDSIDKYEGTASVKLTSEYVSLAGDTVAGTLAIGTGVFGGGGPELLGTPFVSSPDTLEFAYKYAPVGDDTAGFSIKLHKAGASTYKLQWHGVLPSTSGQWAMITLPLKQLYSDTTGTTDTLLLEFNSSMFGGGSSSIKARVGSILHVDAVRFGYYVPAVVGTMPDAYTMGHDPITGYDFNLYGAVNAQGDSGVYKFIYSIDSTFATQSSTIPKPFGGNSLKVVYATVTSLTPATTYYYYVKATTNQGTTHGTTMKFYSDTIQTIFANDGGDVTEGTTWAQLNGRLSGFHTNLTLYFEYGETPLMGKQIVPSDVTSVSDSLTHYFRAFPDSVESGKLYFFRAKAVSATDSVYSDIRAYYTGFGAYTLFQSLAATNVTDSSTTFNGQSKGFQLPLKHKVEIFNASLGHYHSPYQYYAPDTVLINYQLHKTGLQPGTYYQTRFKAETWIGNYYSDSAFTTPGVNGINDIASGNNILVYPNPSNGLVTIETSKTLTGEALVQLYTLNGQLAKQQTISIHQNKIYFSVSDVPTGFYLLGLTSEGKTYNQKIAVVK